MQQRGAHASNRKGSCGPWRARCSVVASTAALVVLPQAVAGAQRHRPAFEPSANVPPQVMPACTSRRWTTQALAASTRSCTTSTTRARSKDSARSCCRATTPASPSRMQQLILTDEERGDRGLTQFSGPRRATSTPPHWPARQPSQDPVTARPATSSRRGSRSSRRTTRRSGPTSPGCTTTGYGGTNLLCTSADLDRIAGVTATPSSAPGTPTTRRPPHRRWATATPRTAQYAQIFCNQKQPAPTPSSTR